MAKKILSLLLLLSLAFCIGHAALAAEGDMESAYLEGRISKEELDQYILENEAEGTETYEGDMESAYLDGKISREEFALYIAENAGKYKVIENFDEFDVELEIPEGAFVRQELKDGWLWVEIYYEDPAKPSFDVNIAFSEEMAGEFLGDLPQEDLDHLMDMVGEAFSIPVHELFVTPSGNTILYTRETDPEAGDYASMTTVYKGFFFQLHCNHNDYAPLTEADIRLMHQIIEGAWIIDTE